MIANLLNIGLLLLTNYRSTPMTFELNRKKKKKKKLERIFENG